MEKRRMELVSVVIPAYNAEKTLRNTLISVCRQTYRNVEIIVVNDGSVDGTQDIADKMQEEDRRIIVRHIDHGGVSNARNIALRICHGRFIAFIDADDIMEKNMIENLIRHMNPGIDMVCCGYQVRNAKEKILFQQKPEEGIWKYDDLYQAIAMLQDKKCLNMLWNKLFRASIIQDRNLRMDSQVSMGEDLLFLIAYLKYCTGNVYVISECGYYYTLSSGGLQFRENKNNNLKRRLDQLGKLFVLYQDRQYPIDGLCKEIMRCFYTSMMESEKPAEVMKEICNTEEYGLLCQEKLKYGIKYRIFLKLLQCSNVKVTVWAVRIFRYFKMLSGAAFRWQP